MTVALIIFGSAGLLLAGKAILSAVTRRSGGRFAIALALLCGSVAAFLSAIPAHYPYGTPNHLNPQQAVTLLQINLNDTFNCVKNDISDRAYFNANNNTTGNGDSPRALQDIARGQQESSAAQAALLNGARPAKIFSYASAGEMYVDLAERTPIYQQESSSDACNTNVLNGG